MHERAVFHSGGHQQHLAPGDDLLRADDLVRVAPRERAVVHPRHERAHELEVLGGVDGPTLTTEPLVVADIREPEALRPPVDERRHVLTLGGVGRFLARRPQHRSAHDFDVESLREGPRAHVARVVGVVLEVPCDDCFHELRIDQRAVGREPDHMVGRRRIERRHEPAQHVGLGAAHDAIAGVTPDIRDHIVTRERARRDHQHVDVNGREPVEHEPQHGPVVDGLEHFAGQARRTRAGLHHARDAH